MSHFSAVCSSGSKSQQVHEECSCPERGRGHHGNLDGSLCQNDNCSPSSSHSLSLAHSEIALYSHEYFIQKCAVCTSAALNTNEKLFPFWGGKKSSCEVNRCDEE